MAHLIPSYCSSKDNLLGEHRIFQLLKNSKELDKYYVFHSLNIVNHSNKREGEADFVILGPLGLLDIEIKGSIQISIQGGNWTYVNGNKRYTANESPFNQAKTNIYSLMKNIAAKIPDLIFDLKKFIGYGVIFPNMVFNLQSVEWDKKLILDENNLDNLDQFILSVYEYWRAKASFIKGLDLLQDEDIKRIRQYLRPDYESVDSVRSFLERNARKIDLLTEDQALVLERLADNDRILIKGFAGTGKTFLAIEQCKRVAQQGEKVLFLCFNKLLSKNIYTQLMDFKPVIDVYNLDSLFYKIISKTFGHSDFKDNDEMRDFLFDNMDSEDLIFPQYDYLVIDEGQDILTDKVIGILNRMLGKGFWEGRWSLFLDDEVQSGLFGEKDLAECIEKIKKISSSYTLDTNCRNPKNIIEETNRITQLPVAKYKRLEAGTDNMKIIPYHGERELTEKLTGLLNDVVTTGVKPQQITVLMPKRNPGIIDGLFPGLKFKCRGFVDILETAKNMTSPAQVLMIPAGCISYSTIQAFKGMENEVIILAGIESLENDWENSVLYIGMTRARAKLYILYSYSLKQKFL